MAQNVAAPSALGRGSRQARVAAEYRVLEPRALGALRLAWRRAHVDDDWTKNGTISEGWDRWTAYPYVAELTYDLAFATRMLSKFSDSVPAWREVIGGTMDKLVWRFCQYAGFYRVALSRAFRSVVERTSVAHRIGHVSIPTLIIAGAEDHALPPVRSQRLAREIPGATLHVIPDIAHLAPRERRRPSRRCSTISWRPYRRESPAPRNRGPRCAGSGL